jgi:hypothetical protein
VIFILKAKVIQERGKKPVVEQAKSIAGFLGMSDTAFSAIGFAFWASVGCFSLGGILALYSQLR